MSVVLKSLALMWKGMVAIFTVMLAIFLLILVLSPRDGQKQNDGEPTKTN